MRTNEPLDPDLQSVHDELSAYHAARLSDVQHRRTRKGIAKNMDGDYSLVRLLSAMRADTVQRTAPFEWQTSQRIAERIGHDPTPGYCFIPIDTDRRYRRDLQLVNTGGYLVQTDVGPGDTFAQLLDELLPFTRLGMPRLSLQRPATFPGIDANFDASWQTDEGTVITADSSFALAIQSSSPKTIGAYTLQSDRFVKQSGPFGQRVILYGLARAVVNAMVRAVLTGTGSGGQLQGIYGYTGVNTVGAASANHDTLTDMIAEVESASALLTPSSAGFVMPSNIAKLLRTRQTASGGGMVMTANSVSGYPGIVSEGASPNSLTFGDFSQSLLLEYNQLQIGTDPYGVSGSDQFRAGQVAIRCLWTCDIVLLNPSSFCTSGKLD